MNAPRYTPPEEFRLTDIEKGSLLWRRLNAHLLERLAERRRQNDGPQHGVERTAFLRGEIATLKYLTEDILRAPIAAQSPHSAAGE